jgi:hypothetical protein
VLALAVFVALNLWALPAQLPIHTPYRDLFRAMSARAAPGDVVYFEQANQSGLYTRWHIDRYLASPLHEHMVGELAEAQAAPRVWFVTAKWFEPDVQAAFAALQTTHTLEDVLGDCNREWCYLIQLLEAPPLRAPFTFGEHMAFWGANVGEPADGRVEARLWWRVAEAPPNDYSISLQLLDTDGALVAQLDGPIRSGDVILQTSQLPPDSWILDTRALELPPGLSAGNYRLVLVVYQSWDGVRLRLPDGGDNLTVGAVTIS